MLFPQITIGLVGVCLVAGIYASDPVWDLPHRGCYFTNWSQYRTGLAKYTYANVDTRLCTYIVIAFANIANNQLAMLEWNDDVTYAKLADLKQTSSPNLKILVSVGGWTLTAPLVAMASNPDSRKTFIASAVTNLRLWGMDGLDVDWEFPLTADKTTYSTLLTELRQAFEEEAKSTGKVRLALTAAVHLISDGGFDGAVIEKTLDVANVMTYDLAGAWIPTQTGHLAPLTVGPFRTPSPLNVEAIMQAWVDAGVSKSRLTVGLPLYGRGWVLTNPRVNGLGAPANGGISAGVYTKEAGSWAYFEVCQNIQSQQATDVFDTTINASYAYHNTWWIGYDSIQTITGKTNWAKAAGYGGVFVWDLSQDDFTNLCGTGYNPLMNAIKCAQSDVPFAPQTVAYVQGVAPSPTTPTTTTTTGSSNGITTTNQPTTLASILEDVGNMIVGAATELIVNPAGNNEIGNGALPNKDKECTMDFCTEHGPGVVALGNCTNLFCNCGALSTNFTSTCGPNLIFDSAHLYCNFRDDVAACVA
ncbi:Acidic mammalian chitinase [Hypsibius exemplaris]|uniref:chitinase n=1 Tax=Hypsibius exemplaris TaxID=2072580 RepID=A0A9X6NES8_HYPEX|nr:Acidic mammalian chitinase [Hypsibius exemplaris]